MPSTLGFRCPFSSDNQTQSTSAAGRPGNRTHSGQRRTHLVSRQQRRCARQRPAGLRGRATAPTLKQEAK